jgi:hypothetical protein
MERGRRSPHLPRLPRLAVDIDPEIPGCGQQRPPQPVRAQALGERYRAAVFRGDAVDRLRPAQFLEGPIHGCRGALEGVALSPSLPDQSPSDFRSRPVFRLPGADAADPVPALLFDHREHRKAPDRPCAGHGAQGAPRARNPRSGAGATSGGQFRASASRRASAPRAAMVSVLAMAFTLESIIADQLAGWERAHVDLAIHGSEDARLIAARRIPRSSRPPSPRAHSACGTHGDLPRRLACRARQVRRR